MKGSRWLLLFSWAMVWAANAYQPLSNEALEEVAGWSSKERLAIAGDLLSPLLVKRVSGTPENIRVREYIVQHFQTLGWHVEVDKFTDTTPMGDIEFANIIATKNPNAERRLVLSAHFDSKYFEQIEFIGATDSAVPCAILMEIAETLNDVLDPKDGNSDTTLQMIFFDGEEAFKAWSRTDSTYGSRHLAEQWERTYVRQSPVTVKSQTKLGQIDVLVLLDLLGTRDAMIPNYYASTSWLFDALVSLEQRLLDLSLLETTSVQSEEPLNRVFYTDLKRFRGGEDDHIPFVERGVPVLHVIPSPFPAVWHSATDNADALDLSVIRNLSLLFRNFVLEYLELDPLADD